LHQPSLLFIPPDLGFNKKDVIVIPIVDEEIKHSIESFKKEVKNYTAVANVSATSTLPGWYIPRNLKIPQGFTNEQMQLMDDINVDHDFIPTLEIKMVSGRNFSENYATDQIQGIIINETAAKKYGWDNPVGKTIKYGIGQDKFATGTVCGVVQDFHLASLHRVIEPLFISNNPENINYLLIRIQPEDMQRTIDQIKTRWHDVYPHHPFEYTFLEHSYDHYFRVIEKVQQVFYYFIFLTIFIACLGIFALAIYNTEHRIKEIGIRKVLGASTLGIILTLNKEIVKLVLIAIVLALLFIQIPLLDPRMFLPYFVDVNFTLYLKSALIVAVIAFSTILYQSIKTALANPINSLRHE
jgi:putative ABC transport system permease protein